MNNVFSGNTSKLLDIWIQGSGNYSELFQISLLTD